MVWATFWATFHKLVWSLCSIASKDIEFVESSESAVYIFLRKKYIYVNLLFVGHIKVEHLYQGDQIGRTFAHWAEVYFGLFIEKY
jgi:hypothetical protein